MRVSASMPSFFISVFFHLCILFFTGCYLHYDVIQEREPGSAIPVSIYFSGRRHSGNQAQKTGMNSFNASKKIEKSRLPGSVKPVKIPLRSGRDTAFRRQETRESGEAKSGRSLNGGVVEHPVMLNAAPVEPATEEVPPETGTERGAGEKTFVKEERAKEEPVATRENGFPVSEKESKPVLKKMDVPDLDKAIEYVERVEATEAVAVDLKKPVYPALSKRRNEEGVVILSVEVHDNGKTGRIMVVSSSGFTRLDRAAVRTLEHTGFIPASTGGRPVFSIKRIAFTFRLEGP